MRKQITITALTLENTPAQMPDRVLHTPLTTILYKILQDCQIDYLKY